MTVLLAALLVGAPALSPAHAAPVESVVSPGFVVEAPLLSEDEVPEDVPGSDDGNLFERNKPLAITLTVIAGVAATIVTVALVYVGAVFCCVCFFVNGYYY
ncbi:MAG: hypothetical protein GY913_27000 [Proteobacteria bacterium]|nr:hypothetical protein [Pseudomonadota bacterium]MCP4920563.1 hypothetical protein [Pseudomonadota bacterium]